jgi:hypothetical protein
MFASFHFLFVSLLQTPFISLFYSFANNNHFTFAQQIIILQQFLRENEMFSKRNGWQKQHSRAIISYFPATAAVTVQSIILDQHTQRAETIGNHNHGNGN